MPRYSLLSIFVILLLCFSQQAQGQQYKWLRSPSSATSLAPTPAVDAAGCVYLTGTFHDGDVFGNTTLHTQLPESSYLAKYDPKGNIRWALNIGANQSFQVVDLEVNPTGESYILGHFYGQALEIAGQTFMSNQANAYSTGSFLAKFGRKGTGVLWANQLDGFPTDIGVDAAGNVNVAGVFIEQMQIGNIVLSDPEPWWQHTFLARYSPQGQLSWAHKIMESTNFTFPKICVSSTGVSTLLWTTNFLFPLRHAATRTSSGSSTISDYPTSQELEAGSYLGRFSPKGKQMWFRQIIKAGISGGYEPTAFQIDRYGSTYLAGNLYGTAVFGADTLKGIFISEYEIDGVTYYSYYRNELFVAKINKRGQAIWARKSTNSKSINGAALALDGKGGLIAASSYRDTMSIGSQTFTTATNSSDIFVAHYTATGAVDFVSTAGGTGQNDVRSIVGDDRGNFYLTGLSASGAIFGSLVNSSTAPVSPFLARLQWQPGSTQREDQKLFTEPAIASDSKLRVSVFPNPGSGHFGLTITTETAGQMHTTITDLMGKQVISKTGQMAKGTAQLNLELGELPAGVYLVTVSSGDQRAVSRLIKQ